MEMIMFTNPLAASLDSHAMVSVPVPTPKPKGLESRYAKLRPPHTSELTASAL